jgi:poly [ADP-ribose] polymerase 2/3/4
VYAERGKSLLKNEFIIYNSDQCTVRYLVRVKE